MNSTACILLLTNDPELENRWAEMLRTADGQIVRGLSRLTAKAPLDVVVTDRHLVSELVKGQNKRLARGEIGIVAVGSGGLADVNLPTDCTPRELRLACLLLSEIVRGRRQQRRDERARKVLTQLALSDPLTGLPNRRAWDDELPVRFRTVQARGQRLCLAMLDLDHFKRVNDELGHLMGDELLRNVGQTLASHARPTRDYVARLGGDEFGLLVMGCDGDSGFDTVEQFRVSLSQMLVQAGQQPVTASVGMIQAAGEELGAINQLWQLADKALRQAKSNGRDQTIVITMN